MKRSKFSLSNTKLLSCDMGELVPIGITEVLPGDSIQQATSALVRCSPLLAPIMHPVHVRIHHWFVPHRLTWGNVVGSVNSENGWEQFITGGKEGEDAQQVPFITSPAMTGFGIGSLADYMGIPTGVPGMQVNALPFRAYAMIWNEWYRDQDLQTELVIDTGGGGDTTTSTALQNVCWEKDYFTSARPFVQKGPDVLFPLGSRIPVRGIGAANQTYSTGPVNAYETDKNAATSYATFRKFEVDNANQMMYVQQDGTTGYPNIFADTSVTGVAPNIVEVREAFALQRFEEARARYGSRYTEYLRYLGVRSSDARLQRPEYLGGGKQTIQFSEVLQSAPVYDSAEEELVGAVGSLKGHGIGALRSNRYRRFFEEHGYIITVLSVKPKTIYANGLARHWIRQTKEDFFQKELQHIGQQEITKKEIYAAAADPDDNFGYQDRYDEYRRTESTIAGEFRSTLNFWHYARLFGSEPELNADFVKAVPTKRTNADTGSDCLYVMVQHSIQARRIVAKTGGSFIL